MTLGDRGQFFLASDVMPTYDRKTKEVGGSSPPPRNQDFNAVSFEDTRLQRFSFIQIALVNVK